MDTMKSRIICMIVSYLHVCYGNQQTFECPSRWYKYGESCYQFNADVPQTWEEARISCTSYGAGLVSVSTRQEHEFIVNWLQVYESDIREWYTSGYSESSKGGRAGFVWEGTGEAVDDSDQTWTRGRGFNDSPGVIIYKATEGGFWWCSADPSEKRPYICEVPEAESYRILQDVRDFDYGMHHADLNKIERGPHFILQTYSTLVVGKPPDLVLECVAIGVPHPSYTWWKGDNFEELLTPNTDNRYTFTNGKIIISSPEESRDSGVYRCQAENQFGIIISDDIRVSFGDIGEFSNVPDAPVNAKAYEGAAIDCSRITYKPAIRYQWFKRGVDQFVRPQFQKYMFISQSGKLYFSEVTRADEGKYFCVAILTGLNQYTIGTSQPPTRTSLPILLHVHDKGLLNKKFEGSNVWSNNLLGNEHIALNSHDHGLWKSPAPIAEWGPVIQNEFIGVYPKPPMVGQDVKLECFAYGSSTTDFHYSWKRQNSSLPKKSFLMDHNRLLVIREATIDDQGVYTCYVSRGSNTRDQKSVDLKLSAKPFFISPLRNQHADIGSQLTWRCDARASPTAYFHWYKNGRMLHSDPNTYIKVVSNVLTISHLDPDLHNGMYQCAATNSFGTTMSEGQLRVLSLGPNFVKYPMQPLTRTSVLGNLTLFCRPEGAPLPVIKWYKNGAELPVSLGNVAHVSRGYLTVKNVNKGDAGNYTCRATNVFGEAEDSTTITVSEGTFLTVAPHDQTANVNTTVFFYCQASHAHSADLIYSWLLNGHKLDSFWNPEYKSVKEPGSGRTGLYISCVGFHNAGYYECVALTTINSDRKGAYLSVVGPPSEPAGVLPDSATVTNSSVVVRWTDGFDNGRPITNYIVEVSNVFEKDQWETGIGDLAAVDTLHEVKRKRWALVTRLNPGCGYKFRVTAVNQFGAGPPSMPSAYIQTLSAPPRVAPGCVGGGDGRVGDLTMTWTPLTRCQQAGGGIGYRLYWRRHSHKEDVPWSIEDLAGNTDHYVTQVGADNYYLEYDFMIQAFNDDGFGPNSSQAVIMSAEDLPVATATNVQAQGYNGTATEVFWTPVPQERQYARGKILGYQINYWHEDEEMTDWKDFIRHEGQIDAGLVIGLKSDDFYSFTIQVYNSAGLGPMSEYFFQETLHFPAAQYPEEIRVISAGGHHVEVWWRGINIIQQEGNIYGFVIFYWPANEPYRTACQHVVHDHHAHHAHIDVDPGVVYAVRVSAFGEGGYGKKSLTTYFTLEGNNILVDYNLAQIIQAFRSSSSTSSIYGHVVIVVCLFILFVEIVGVS